MSIQTYLAKPLTIAPTQKRMPPESIVNRLPKERVTVDATIDDTSAAR